MNSLNFKTMVSLCTKTVKTSQEKKQLKALEKQWNDEQIEIESNEYIKKQGSTI